MGVYIPGMEMPISCRECRFDRGGWCYATDRVDSRTRFVTNDAKQKWCPIVPVPPHGRLIDADALLKHEVFIPFDGGHLPVVYVSYVRHAPTIIPAEEGDE